MNVVSYATVLTLLIFLEVDRADSLDTWTLRYTVPVSSGVFRNVL